MTMELRIAITVTKIMKEMSSYYKGDNIQKPMEMVQNWDRS